jgi:hypothetical protein
MDTQAAPYLLGSGIFPSLPLERYLPRLPVGSLREWLNTHVPAGAWVLDPLGLHPQVALEAAQAGYRVLVACNHPLLAFLLQNLAAGPGGDAFRKALAALLATRRGEQRLEQYLLSLYQTTCPRCKAVIPASGYLWQRGAHQPHARLLHCPHCGEQGEFTLTPEDQAILQSIGTAPLHRARALSRLGAVAEGEARSAAENLLHLYPPRALTVLFTLLNRSEGPGLTPEQRTLLHALLIPLLDRGTALWPWPPTPLRPRLLQSPPVFLEINLMQALDDVLALWGEFTTPIPLTQWPALPPPEGGICLFRGRMRTLATQPDLPAFGAVLAVLTRPSAAFWGLSVLWSAWLWGEDVARPLLGLLNPRAAAWNWLAHALHHALRPPARLVHPETPLWLMADELTPAAALTVLLGAHTAGWEAKALAYDPEAPALQTTWQVRTTPLPTPTDSPKPCLHQALQRHLNDRAEPADYLPLFLEGILALSAHGYLPATIEDMPTGYAGRLQALVNEVLADASTFTRLHARAEGESGPRWGLTVPPAPETLPLADRAEKAVVGYLLNHPIVTAVEVEQAMRRHFPGLITPRRALLRAILTSYAQEMETQTGHWQLRPQDQPDQRRRDLQAVAHALRHLAARLGYQAEGENPLLWRHPPSNEVRYAFYLLASAMVWRFLTAPQPQAQHHVLVLPGSRAGLLAYKLQRDPRLAAALQRSWHVLKFRHLHRMASQADLGHDLWDALLDSDPPLWRETAQMSMF